MKLNSKTVIQIIFTAGLLITLLIPSYSFAQKDSTNTDTAKATEAVVEEEASSLISPSLDFVTVQKANNTIDLRSEMKTKIKGSFIKLPLLKITYFLVNADSEKELGFVITDKLGKAVFNTKADSLLTDKDGALHFKAVFAGNKQMDPADAEVTIKRARLEITPVKGDSLNVVQVKLIDLATGAEKPVPEAVLGIFVQRMFNPLKIGEATTDENGEGSVEIPGNLPGDEKGNIILIAKLDENENYGNLEATVTQKWGIPITDKMESQQRALWSSHPPLWMVITFIILMGAVWGHYIVIVYQLIKLRKEEPHPPVHVS
jgi:hypothetical protein